jgi:hypothetical protein
VQVVLQLVAILCGFGSRIPLFLSVVAAFHRFWNLKFKKLSMFQYIEGISINSASLKIPLN